MERFKLNIIYFVTKKHLNNSHFSRDFAKRKIFAIQCFYSIGLLWR